MTLPEIDHVSFLVEHAQTFFAGERQTQLDDIAHKQTIICRQLFAGYVYVVGSRLMKKKEKFASNYNNSFSETSSTSFENNASKFRYFSAAE